MKRIKLLKIYILLCLVLAMMLSPLIVNAAGSGAYVGFAPDPIETTSPSPTTTPTGSPSPSPTTTSTGSPAPTATPMVTPSPSVTNYIKKEEDGNTILDVPEKDTRPSPSSTGAPDRQASEEPDTTVFNPNDEFGRDEIPTTGVFWRGEYWALLNLLLGVCNLVVLALILVLKTREKKQEDNGMQPRKKRLPVWAHIIPALLSVLLFYVTEDVSMGMIFTDAWTIPMAIITMAQLVLLVLDRRNTKQFISDS